MSEKALTPKFTFTISAPIWEVTYTNWMGVKRIRRLQPRALWFGSNQWHPEPQWIIDCLDTEDGEVKGFALKGFELT